MLLMHCLLFAVFAARFNTNPQIATRISISARLATRIPKRGTKRNANFCTPSNLSQTVSNGSPGHCGDLRATANHQHPQHQQPQHQKEGRPKPHFLIKRVVVQFSSLFYHHSIIILAKSFHNFEVLSGPWAQGLQSTWAHGLLVPRTHELIGPWAHGPKDP